jgi:hypothetical protein
MPTITEETIAEGNQEINNKQVFKQIGNGKTPQYPEIWRFPDGAVRNLSLLDAGQ